ncbi:MAG TPA: hypothetical protein VGQ48_00340 [Gemmatimonadales bacterium]|jgi:hypothetical protein|nr:hypothetical protein [Gemmatimonadales bacterium]
MPSWLDVLLKVAGFLLSVAALVISMRAFRRSTPLTQMQTRLAALELEAKTRAQVAQSKADVRASIHRTGQYSYDLVIENKNPAATATNVNIEFVNPEDETIFPQGERDRHLPVAELPGGDYVRIIAALASGRWPPFDVVLTWTDPDGTEQHKETKLRLS